MSLKDKANEEFEKRKIDERKHKEYCEKIKRNLPLKVKEFMDWVEEICKDTKIRVKRSTKPAELFLHYNNSPLGQVELDTVTLELFEKRLTFEPEDGLGYVGADGKISIDTNVRNWERRFDLSKGGIFLILEEDLAKSYFKCIDSKFKAHELTKELLEKLIEAILV
jgi:hypothetical protein